MKIKPKYRTKKEYLIHPQTIRCYLKNKGE